MAQRWRVKQFGTVLAEFDSRAEADRFVYLYEMDDADTMRIEVREDGGKRWQRILTQS